MEVLEYNTCSFDQITFYTKVNLKLLAHVELTERNNEVTMQQKP